MMTIKEKRERAAVEAMPLLPGNPVVFMDITVNDEPIGRLVFQLRKDAAPRTAANFEALCTHSAGFGYRASRLHGGERLGRIFGGDFYGTGTGGHSIYGPTFPDENLEGLGHLGPGTLAMRSAGPDSNSSQFYITLRALPEFDGLCQVAGYMVEGWPVLARLGKMIDGEGRFKDDVRIAGCGTLADYRKPGTGTGTSAGSDGDDGTGALLAAVAEASTLPIAPTPAADIAAASTPAPALR